jgi:hypothetical protein
MIEQLEERRDFRASMVSATIPNHSTALSRTPCSSGALSLGRRRQQVEMLGWALMVNP